MTKKQFIQENIPIEELKEVGFFKQNDSFKEMENKLCRYFGLKNIFMYSFIGEPKNGKPVKADINTYSDN